MKTFKDLSIKDSVYAVYGTEIKKVNIKIIKIDFIELLISNGGSSDFSIENKHYDKKDIYLVGNYNVSYHFFVNKSDAIVYAKSNAIKVLEELKDKALKAINDVYKFRENYYNELNNDWTERQIIQLQKLEQTI